MGIGSLTERRRAVFLDRDGVLNHCKVVDGRPYPPDTVEELQVIEDAPTACEALSAAGFLLIVATNQPDIGRGKQSAAVVEAMHAKLRLTLPLTAVYVCPHGGDGCECRKPKPGMLRQAASDLGIDLRESYMIGDRWRDVNCGNAAECKTAFIDYGYDEELRDRPTITVRTISEAAAWILADAATSDME